MTTRDRRAVVIGAAVAAAALLALRGVPWMMGGLANRQHELAARQLLVARTQAQVRDAEAVGDSMPAVEQRLGALAARLLGGPGDGDAVADLSSRIGAAAAAERVRVVRTATAADTVRIGRLRRVTLQAWLEGDARGTLGVLARLERGPAAIALADVRLTAVDPASPPAAPELIAEEIVLRGWYMTASPAPGASP